MIRVIEVVVGEEEEMAEDVVVVRRRRRKLFTRMSKTCVYSFIILHTNSKLEREVSSLKKSSNTMNVTMI